MEVENTHSFVSESFCLHNCGDVMWVYIKVGKDKKGEEFLKDVKFKTFGCAAAIASSSMLTQIAKGKTIKDAEKIQNKDVAKLSRAYKVSKAMLFYKNDNWLHH